MLTFEGPSPGISRLCTGVVAFSALNTAESQLGRMIFGAKYYCLVNTPRLDACLGKSAETRAIQSRQATLALPATRIS